MFETTHNLFEIKNNLCFNYTGMKNFRDFHYFFSFFFCNLQILNDVTPIKAFFWIVLVNVSLRTQTYFAEIRCLRSQAGKERLGGKREFVPRDQGFPFFRQ